MSRTLDPFETQLVAAQPKLMAYAVKLTRKKSLAEDLVQEANEKALRNRHQFDLSTSMMAWLTVILRNSFFNGFRKSQYEVEADDTYIVNRPDLYAYNVEAADELRAVYRHLDVIEPEKKQALLSVTVGGLSYEQVADLQEIPCGTVKSRVHRARESLQHALRGPA